MWNSPELARGTRCAQIQRGGRTISFTATSALLTEPVAILFPPLAATSMFVGSAEFAAAANEVGLCVLSVDRPGIAGTTASPRRLSDVVRTRLDVHALDVAAVLQSLGVRSKVRLIGVCAGAPYALSVAAALPSLVDLTHVTLVTPWISGECPTNSWLVRTAAAGWLGPHACIGPLLALMQAPRMRRIFGTSKLDRAVQMATAGFSSSERSLLTRRCALDRHLAKRLIGALRRDVSAHTEGGFAGDVAVCLAPARKLEAGRGKSTKGHEAGSATSVPRQVTVIAAALDELVPLPATAFLCERLAGAGASVNLYTCLGGSHTGVQYLRAHEWLRAAVSPGVDLGGSNASPESPYADCGLARIRTLERLQMDAQVEASRAAAAMALLGDERPSAALDEYAAASRVDSI